MGAMGALMTPPAGIRDWVQEFRANSQGPFQLNLWIPDPPAARDAEAETRLRNFLAQWGPAVPASAGDTRLPDFARSAEAFLELSPTAVSSIMGVFRLRSCEAEANSGSHGLPRDHACRSEGCTRCGR
jgi:nitronate monooxygenase